MGRNTARLRDAAPHASVGRRATRSAATLATLVCLGAAGLAGPAEAVAADPARSGSHRVMAHLSGANEVPGNGDRDGYGHAVIKLRPGAGKACANASWGRIGKPTGVHIHRGGPRANGPVVIGLTRVVTSPRDCTRAPGKLLRRISNHPGRYYFNIHTGRYPAGAIRGQLEPYDHH